MKILFLSLSFLFFISCEKNDVVYLYDENSPEWPQILALREQKCRAEGIYTEIAKANQFNRFSVGKRYLFKKMSKTNGGNEFLEEDFGLRIEQINPGTSLTVALRVPNGSLYHYHLSQAESENIIQIITDGTCYNKYTKSVSGSTLRFNHKLRKILEPNTDPTKDPVRYDEYTRSFDVSPDFPSLFHMFRGTVTLKKYQNTTEVVSTTEYRHTLTELDCSNSENEKYCNFTTGPIANCNAEAQISSPPYNLENFTSSDTEATLVKFTGDATCPPLLF